MGPLARIRAIAAAAMFLTAVAVAGTYLLLPSPSLDRGRSASVLVLASDGSILRAVRYRRMAGGAMRPRSPPP